MFYELGCIPDTVTQPHQVYVAEPMQAGTNEASASVRKGARGLILLSRPQLEVTVAVSFST